MQNKSGNSNGSKLLNVMQSDDYAKQAAVAASTAAREGYYQKTYEPPKASNRKEETQKSVSDYSIATTKRSEFNE